MHHEHTGGRGVFLEGRPDKVGVQWRMVEDGPRWVSWRRVRPLDVGVEVTQSPGQNPSPRGKVQTKKEPLRGSRVYKRSPWGNNNWGIL